MVKKIKTSVDRLTKRIKTDKQRIDSIVYNKIINHNISFTSVDPPPAHNGSGLIVDLSKRGGDGGDSISQIQLVADMEQQDMPLDLSLSNQKQKNLEPQLESESVLAIDDYSDNFIRSLIESCYSVETIEKPIEAPYNDSSFKSALDMPALDFVQEPIPNMLSTSSIAISSQISTTIIEK